MGITQYQLKDILQNEVQNTLKIALNNPKTIIERRNIINTDITSNPFINNNVLSTLNSLIQEEIIRVEFECLYTADRNLVVENDRMLGLNLDLSLYIKFDDVKNSPLGTILETDSVIFKNKRYTIKSLANLYDILQRLKLE